MNVFIFKILLTIIVKILVFIDLASFQQDYYRTIRHQISQVPFKTNQNLSNLDQQIIQSIPKLNLESFGIEIKNSKTKDIKTSVTDDIIHHGDNEDAEREEKLKHLRNSLRELEWEYFDRDLHGRPRQPSSSSTTTSKPFYNYKPLSRTRRPYYRPDPPLSTTTRKSTTTSATIESFPARDCQQECVPQHYLQHYYLKNCHSVFSRDCNCAKHFLCSNESLNPLVNRMKGPSKDFEEDYCVLNDSQRYSIGQIIPIPNKPCSICRCLRDHSVRKRSVAQINCSQVVECPELAFGVRPSRPECYYAYSHDRCCGVEICPELLNWDDNRLRKCRYRNRTYRYGEQIELLENRCKRCICNEYWNEYDPEASKESCSNQICPMGQYHRLNCIPIYQRDICCPLDYICREQNITAIVTTTKDSDSAYRKYFKFGYDSNTNSDVNNDDNIAKQKYHCWLNGKRYRLGHTVHVTRDSTLYQHTCATCQCKIPPLMTCEVNPQCLINDNISTI